MTVQVLIKPVVLPRLPGRSAKDKDANRERECWQIQDLDGNPLWEGLFVGPELARQHCSPLGWIPKEDQP